MCTPDFTRVSFFSPWISSNSVKVMETRLAKTHTKAEIRSYFQEREKEQQNQPLCSASSLFIFKSDNFKNKEEKSPGNEVATKLLL